MDTKELLTDIEDVVKDRTLKYNNEYCYAYASGYSFSFFKNILDSADLTTEQLEKMSSYVNSMKKGKKVLGMA